MRLKNQTKTKHGSKTNQTWFGISWEIVADNFSWYFSALDLCNKLMSSSFGYVGIVYKKKRFIPVAFSRKYGDESIARVPNFAA